MARLLGSPEPVEAYRARARLLRSQAFDDYRSKRLVGYREKLKAADALDRAAQAELTDPEPGSDGRGLPLLGPGPSGGI